MIMEELIFRYYLIGFLVSTLQQKIGISVIVSAVLFSLYHIHTWFTYKSLKILFINLSYTLLLGAFLGFTFFTLGIIFCVVVHYILALYLWYSIFRNIKQSGIN
jgi:membrane protease YdiL (CAAX protease family)